MKLILFASISIALILNYVYAQAPDWESGKTCEVIGPGWGSVGRSTTIDISGNIYVTGTFSDDTIIFINDTLINLGSNSMFIVKYDKHGICKWARQASSYINANVTGNSILSDKIGNVYVGGHFNGDTMSIEDTLLFNTSPSHEEIFIAKYDSSGSLIWVKTLQGNFEDELARMDIDSSANLYFTGFFSSYSLDFGNIQLTNPNSLASENFFIAKFDSSGNDIWAKNVFSSGLVGKVIGKGIASDQSGNSYVTGIFNYDSVTFDNFTLINPSGNYFAMFICKYDNAGNVIWSKTAPDSSNNYGRPFDVACDNNGHVYIGGAFRYPFIAFDGDTIWNAGYYNLFVFQFDTAGHENWGRRNGYNNVDLIHRISCDALGNLIVTGEFGGKLYFNGDTLQPVNHDFFVLKYDVLGNESWAKTFAGSNTTSGEDIAINKAGNIFITGAFDGSPTILGNDTLNGPSSIINYFLGKLSFVTVNNSKSTICYGDSIQLIAEGASSYSWSPSSGLNSAASDSVSASPTSFTIYTITGTNQGEISTAKAEIIVNPVPATPIIISHTDTLSTGSGFLYQWYLNDTLIPGAIYRSYIFPTPVYYTKCYKVKQTNSFGCFSFSDTICISPVSINDISISSSFQVFPNPMGSILNINSVKDIRDGKINIYNCFGEMVYSTVFEGRDMKLDFNFENGVYFIQIVNGNSTWTAMIYKI